MHIRNAISKMKSAFMKINIPSERNETEREKPRLGQEQEWTDIAV